MAETVTRVKDGDLRSRVASLETQMESIARSLEKIDGRVDDHYQTLHSRISDMRDEIRVEIETKHDKVIAKLDAHAQNEALENAQLAEKIGHLEKWRWMLVGGAIVVGYIIAHIRIDRLF